MITKTLPVHKSVVALVNSLLFSSNSLCLFLGSWLFWCFLPQASTGAALQSLWTEEVKEAYCLPLSLLIFLRWLLFARPVCSFPLLPLGGFWACSLWKEPIYFLLLTEKENTGLWGFFQLRVQLCILRLPLIGRQPWIAYWEFCLSNLTISTNDLLWYSRKWWCSKLPSLMCSLSVLLWCYTCNVLCT